MGRRAEGDPVLIVVLFGEMKTGRAETRTLWVVQGQLNRNPDPAGDSDCPPGKRMLSAGSFNGASPPWPRPRRKAAGIHRGVERVTVGTAEAEAPPCPQHYP